MAPLREAVELGEFLLGGGEADGQSLDLTEPALGVSLGDPGGQVVADLGQACALRGVWAQHRAADAGVFVPACGVVGAVAGTQGQLAAFELAEEFLPFGLGRGAVLLRRSQGATTGQEGAVSLDYLAKFSHAGTFPQVELVRRVPL